MTKFKRGMLVSLLAPFAFSLGNMAVAACNDCVQIRGETVTLREVGLQEGSHYFAVTSDGRRINLTPGAWKLAQIAVVTGQRMYVDTTKPSASLFND
ncbi:hypothetical protein [Caballeronia sordidicola]|jgi:hypothetical protein|uniref:hypothetical protein n=1 Tax=Caballeronia sordidicola TaxID=196367 RepID=UPI000B77F766|nr:hypothetical protein [Caballeronia sordidicola]